MLVYNALKLNLVLTFQAIIATAVLAPEGSRTYAPDGSKVTVTPPSLPGLAVEFIGTNLDEPDGEVTDFAIISTADGRRLDIVLPLLVLLLDLAEAISAGTGPVNAKNFSLFFLLLMPGDFYQMIYDGSGRKEIVEGFGGPDKANLKAGNDTFIMGDGSARDKVNGGAGNDKIDATLLGNGVKADLDRGVIRDNGTEINHRLINFEEIDGTEFNDVIKGNNEANTLKGFDGNDRLNGLGGNDRLEGGKDRDVLDGGEGDDVLNGGQGRDRFVFNPSADGIPDNDKIEDFEDNYDRLDLSGYGFGSVEEALEKARNIPGGVEFEFDNGDVIRIKGDVNKARIADDIDI